jgi:hypothetical protein
MQPLRRFRAPTAPDPSPLTPLPTGLAFRFRAASHGGQACPRNGTRMASNALSKWVGLPPYPVPETLLESILAGANAILGIIEGLDSGEPG